MQAGDDGLSSSRASISSEGLRKRRGGKSHEANYDAALGLDSVNTSPQTRFSSPSTAKETSATSQISKMRQIAILLQKHHGIFGFVLFFLGVSWFFLFPLVCVTTGELKCRGTYFSENALSPGTANVAFSPVSVRSARDIEINLRERASRADGLFDTMTSVGLTDVHIDELGQVSGILRPKGAADRRDALILVTPFGEANDHATGGCSGPGLMLALAQTLVDVDWLSKNVIFLVARDNYSMRRWLQKYHENIVQSTGKSMGHAGLLLGGLVIDVEPSYPGEFAEAIDVHVAGSNGLLPNLDLVNVIVYLLRQHAGIGADKTRFTPLQRQGSHLIHSIRDGIQAAAMKANEINPGMFGRHETAQYVHRMENLAYFMQSVAFGPSGWHAELLPFDVHGVSLHISYTNNTLKKWTTSEQACLALGKTIEHTVRSLSNLEEKFHQSYFLYILPDLHLFVSIGEYAGSLVLVLSPLLLGFLSEMIDFRGGVLGEGRSDAHDSVLEMLVAIAVLALGICYGAYLLSDGAQGLRSLSRVILSGLAVLMLLVFFMQRLGRGSKASFWRPTLAVLQLYIVVTHAMVGMVNYPLAFISAIWCSLFYAQVKPAQGYIHLLWGFCFWVLVAPWVAALALPYVVVGSDAWALTPEWDSYDLASVQLTMSQIADAYVRHHFMQVPFLLVVHAPAHLLAFAIIFGIIQ